MEGIVAKFKSIPAPVWIGLLATVGIAIVLTRSTARSPNGTIAVQGSSATDATNSAGVAQEVGSLSQTLTNMLNTNNQQMIDANTKSTTALQDSIHTDLQQLLTADATNAAATSGAIQSLQTLFGTGFVGLGGGVTTATQAAAAAQGGAPGVTTNGPVIGNIGPATQELSSGVGTTPKILSGNRGFTAQLDPSGSKVLINWQTLQDQTGSFFQLQEDKDLFANSFAGSNILSGASGTATIDLGGYKLNRGQSYRIVQVEPSQGGAGDHLSFTGSSLLGG